MLGYITEIRKTTVVRKHTGSENPIVDTKRYAVEILHSFSYKDENFFICKTPEKFQSKYKGFVGVHANTGLMASHPLVESQKNKNVTFNPKSYKTIEEVEKAVINNIDSYIESGKDFKTLIDMKTKSMNFKSPTPTYLQLRLSKIL